MSMKNSIINMIVILYLKPVSVCEPFQYGPSCTNSCINCESVCNPVTGFCNDCKAGFKDNENGCQTTCGDFEFGKNCLGDCYNKCREDCVVRTTGKCRDVEDVEQWSATYDTRVRLGTQSNFEWHVEDNKKRKFKSLRQENNIMTFRLLARRMNYNSYFGTLLLAGLPTPYVDEQDRVDNFLIHSLGWAFLLVSIVITFAYFLTKKLNQSNWPEDPHFTFNQFSTTTDEMKEPDTVSQSKLSQTDLPERSHTSANEASKKTAPDTLEYETAV